jgi:hypothetical protein
MAVELLAISLLAIHCAVAPKADSDFAILLALKQAPFTVLPNIIQLKS